MRTYCTNITLFITILIRIGDGFQVYEPSVQLPEVLYDQDMKCEYERKMVTSYIK